MSLPRVVVVGGHGKASSALLPQLEHILTLSSSQVALHFARLAAPTYQVTSLVRTRDQYDDITAAGATPSLLSLEESDVQALTSAFEGARAVLFAAGAGGKAGPERTKAVDFEGAVKVRSFEFRGPILRAWKSRS